MEAFNFMSYGRESVWTVWLDHSSAERRDWTSNKDQEDRFQAF